MRLAMIPPQNIGKPYVGGVATPSGYYSAVPDDSGNYNASFSLWDGTLDGAIYETEHFSLGKYYSEEFWTVYSSTQLSRWSIADYGTALSRTVGPLTVPGNSVGPVTNPGGVLPLGPATLRWLINYGTQIGGEGVTWNGSALMYTETDYYWPSTSIDGTRMVRLSDTEALVFSIYHDYGSINRPGTVITAANGDTLTYVSVMNNGSNFSVGFEAQRVTDSVGLVTQYQSQPPNSASHQLVRKSGGINSIGARVSPSSTPCGVVALSPSFVVGVNSASFDVWSVVGTSLNFLATRAQTFTYPPFGAVRLNDVEFLVLGYGSNVLRGTRFVFDPVAYTFAAAQTVVIDPSVTSGLVQHSSIAGQVLPYNRVLLQYGAANSLTARTKILRSVA